MDPKHAGKYYGKYSGEVTKNEDDDNLGRIMVKVPSVFGADLEVRARPCFASSHFFVPPVGAKVWVEFEAGNASFPLWTGVWYPSGAVPEKAAIKPPENRVIQTPSGHTIELMDKDGEAKIVIRHKDNSYIALDKDGGVLVANKNGSHLFLNAKDAETTLVEEHGNVMRMKSDGLTLINASGALIEIKGDKVKIVAKEALTISAKDVNLESSTVNLGQGAATVAMAGVPFAPGGPAEHALLADTFLMAFATHTHPTALGPSGPPIPLPPLVPPFSLVLSKSVLVKK
jgi:hypothetical protein